MEQFQNCIDPDIHAWLLDQKPKTLSETAKLADQYIAVHRAGRIDQKQQDGKSKPTGPQQPAEEPPVIAPNVPQPIHKPSGSYPKSASSLPGAKVTCYYCKKPRHILANCHKRLAKLVNSTMSSDATNVQLVSTIHSAQPGTSPSESVNKSESAEPINPGFAPHCVTATLIRPDQSHKSVSILRDTGALQSLVCSRYLTDNDYVSTDESRLIRGVTGEVVSIPLVQVVLHSPFCNGAYFCGLVSTLPSGVAVLLGNDLCPDPPAVDVNVLTRSQTAAIRKQAESSTPANTSSDVDQTTSNPDHAGEDDPDPVTNLSTLFEKSQSSSQPLFESVDRVKLIQLQQSDPDLATLFVLATQPDQDYVIRNGVLMRAWRDKCSPQEATIYQVVVPTPLRAKLLYLAHEIPAAGHLGIAKTKDRILRHFYWPSISLDTRNFCRSCDICQRLGKGAPCPPAPLHSLPLVSEPFCQVAIDIVGPLPVCKDTGNRFILSILDLCSVYSLFGSNSSEIAYCCRCSSSTGHRLQPFWFSSGDPVRSGNRLHV